MIFKIWYLKGLIDTSPQYDMLPMYINISLLLYEYIQLVLLIVITDEYIDLMRE